MAAVLGVIAFVGQIVEYATTGQFNVLYWWIALPVALFAITGSALLVRNELNTARPYGRARQLLRLADLSMLPVAGLLLGLSMQPAITAFTPRPLPQASVLYQVSTSTNAADALVGPPVVLAASTDPPPRDYRQGPIVGIGFAIEVDIPGTHLVFDHFCTGEGATSTCGGVRRVHFYTRSGQELRLWAGPANSIKPVARLLTPDKSGTCPDPYIPLHRFASDFAGNRIFTIAAEASGVGWDREELLGCAAPPP